MTGRQFLTVEFAPGGMAYTYHNDGPPLAPGDSVLVNGRGGKGTRTVTVKEAGVPKPEFVTKGVIGKAPPRDDSVTADGEPVGKPEGTLL